VPEGHMNHLIIHEKLSYSDRYDNSKLMSFRA